MNEQKTNRAKTVVRLADPVTLFDKQIYEIVLREPGGGLYGRLGEPRVMVYNATGSGYYVEQSAVVVAYINELIDHEHGDVLFGLLSLEDAKGVKEALFDLFTAAEARLATRRRISSSSASAS